MGARRARLHRLARNAAGETLARMAMQASALGTRRRYLDAFSRGPTTSSGSTTTSARCVEVHGRARALPARRARHPAPRDRLLHEVRHRARRLRGQKASSTSSSPLQGDRDAHPPGHPHAQGRQGKYRSGRRSSTCAAPARSPTCPTTSSWWCATARRRTSATSPKKLAASPTRSSSWRSSATTLRGHDRPLVLHNDPPLGRDRRRAAGADGSRHRGRAGKLEVEF
jgi:hypothetical protein